MTRLEKLETLIEIEEGIKYFDNRIDDLEWSNEFGSGSHFVNIYNKNTNQIDTYTRCIKRLNERFSKLANTLNK